MALFSNDGSAARIFDLQFEPDGDGFLYRPNFDVEAVRITAEEKQAIIEAYHRRMRRWIWLVAGTTILLILVLEIWTSGRFADQHRLAYWAIVSFPTLGLLLLHRRAWYAPARAFERRPSAGRSLSRREIRDRILAEQGYGIHVSTLLIFSALLAVSLNAPSPFRGWNLAWIGAEIAFIIICVTNLYRKWKLSAPP